MKKVLAVILFVCLLFPFASAEDFNLSDLSFDQLLILRKQIESEIISRPEWKKVTVPSGFWTVGKDIPVGEYSISLAPGGGAYIVIKNPNAKYSYDRSIISQGISDTEDNIGRIELLDGYTIEISSGSLIFAPPVSLGF